VHTFPDTFADEVRQVVGDYKKMTQLYETRRRDIDRSSRLSELKKSDEQGFSLVKHLVREKLCDIVMAVIEGTEAASHLFLRDADSGHALHDPKSKDREVLGDYYRFIDQQVGEVMNILDDDTVLCLFSVSSVQRLDGIINLNEWLIQKGYLKLKVYPDGPVPLEEAQVDWSATKAWAMGETGQVYINVKGREKEGVVDPEEHSALLEQLIDDVGNMVEAMGNAVSVEAYRGDDLYFGEYAEIGPDLLLHIDEGRWRTEQRVGFGKGEIINTESLKDEVTEGLGRHGYMSMCGSDFPVAGEMKHVSIRDIAPTLIDIMNLRAPYSTIDYEMDGCSLLQVMGERAEEEKIVQGGEKESEEDKVRSRLEALGY
jgi:predicted AlkP superfamily phosphohydrolase/phosphomutase